MPRSSILYKISKEMTPGERLKKCWELTEWSMNLNNNWQREIERRMQDSYILK